MAGKAERDEELNEEKLENVSGGAKAPSASKKPRHAHFSE